MTKSFATALLRNISGQGEKSKVQSHRKYLHSVFLVCLFKGLLLCDALT